MNKSRRLLLAGVGTITPAFMLADGAAKARTPEPAAIEHVGGAAAIELDREVLKMALLVLTPAEKLRIAGDRIRLAKQSAKQKASKPGGGCSRRLSGCGPVTTN